MKKEQTKLLEVQELCIKYRGAASCVINHLSFDVKEGEILCLHGRSGAGKSTIVWAITGMLPEYDASCEGGHIWYHNMDLLHCTEKERQAIRWKEIALVPQSSMNSFNPVFTIGKTMEEMLKLQGGKMTKEQRRAKMEEFMEMVRLKPEILDCYPHQLSGGMKQRAAIALSILFDPKLLILDEATTGLDILIQADVLGTILELKKRKNMTILFISHDAELAKSFCDRRVEL